MIPPSGVPGTTSPARRGAALLTAWQPKFLLLALVWGLSFVYISVAATELAPLQIALGRMATGLVPLAAILLLRRGRLPRSPMMWVHLSVAALLLNVVPFSLFGYAGSMIPSALSGICNAATPLFALGFSLLLLSDERPSRGRLIGLAMGFAGVLVVFGVWEGFAGAATTGMLMAVSATVCYGIGTPYVRRYLTGTGHTTLEMATAQLLTGTAQLLVVTPFFTDMPGPLSPSVLLAVTALGALGTGLAYVLQYAVITQAGATVAATVTYVIPVVAIAAGVLIMGDSLAWNHPVGAAVIIVGAALSHGALRWPGRGRAQSSRSSSSAAARSSG
ncbi:DMT family transporter [Nocardiopsis mangrovi]|uniref:DMT family transporter n=1 Tax=Nocardiopsis mangrovi TaxID=1179818 RepID=A0ABV9DRW7_9ACTN